MIYCRISKKNCKFDGINVFCIKVFMPGRRKVDFAAEYWQRQVSPGQVQVPSVPSIHIMCVFPSEVFLPMEKSKVCISTSTQPRTL